MRHMTKVTRIEFSVITPSHKASARFGSSGLSLLGAPGKRSQKKEKKFMSYLYVKWNSFWAGPLVDGQMIKACFCFADHSRSEGLRRRRRRV